MKISSPYPRPIFYLLAFIGTLMMISSSLRETHDTPEVVGEGIDGALLWDLNHALLTCPKLNIDFAATLSSHQITTALAAVTDKLIVSQSAQHFYKKNPKLHQQDMQFFQQAMEKLLRTKKIAHACKINTLLTQWPEFKILLVGPAKNAIQCTEMTGTHSVNIASFNNVEKTITLIAGFSMGQQVILLDVLAHEFRHAISTFNNFQNRNSLMTTRNGIFAMSNIHGISTFEVKPLDMHNHNRLLQGLSKDTQKIAELFSLFHQDQSYLNARQKAQMNQFIELVAASGYQPRVLFVPTDDVAMIKQLFSQSGDYQYNREQKSYRLKQNPVGNILKAQVANPITPDSPIYFYNIGLDLSAASKGFYKTYTHPKELNSETIAYDVLVNIVMDIEHVRNAYELEVHLEEIDAYIDGHIGDFPELTQFLFPTLYNNRLERSGISFARCV